MESNALPVVKMDALRLHVRLDTLDNKELMLKPEHVCPLLPMAPKPQEQLLKLHDLIQERIASGKEYHRIRIKVKGVKHINTTFSCNTLGNAYVAIQRPADTFQGVTLLIQADKIQCRISDDDKDQALSISRNLSAAQVAQARFDEAGVLSAMLLASYFTTQRRDTHGGIFCWAACAQWQERQPEHVV